MEGFGGEIDALITKGARSTGVVTGFGSSPLVLEGVASIGPMFPFRWGVCVVYFKVGDLINSGATRHSGNSR